MTTATTTARSSELTGEVFALLRDLTRLQLAWSYEGTMEAEATVRRVAAAYGAEVEVTFLADSAVLTMDGGRITAGATRIIYSLAILLVLAFGALVGTVLANVPAGALFDVTVTSDLGIWAVWGGWLIFAVGTMLTFSMRPADFPLALLVLLGTAAAAQLGTRAFGDVVGTFLGAVFMTATALWLGRARTRPPAYVLYLGAFYVLTPGSHGLRGFESWLGGHPIQGYRGLSDMLALLTALAVGMLVTAAVVRR